MNISASAIIDFPLLSSIEDFFRGYKKAGVDGIEIVVGMKTRFRFDYIVSLSQKYALPITSIHQPTWSGLGIYFDEGFIQLAKKTGVKTIVFHPLTFFQIESQRMTAYFDSLQKIQKEYEIDVCLENMKNEHVYKKLFAGNKNGLTHLEDIFQIVSTYNFAITYDTSHAMYTRPQDEDIFHQLDPRIKNIHLSSFTKLVEHLPLTMGDFDSQSFLHYLKKHQYSGLLTFEIYYPKMLTWKMFDFEAIKKSVEIVKSMGR